MNIPVFWTEPTGRARVSLRRYDHRHEERPPCSAGPKSYCDAMVIIHREAPESEWHEMVADESGGHFELIREIADDDPRWPTHCDACGEPLPEEACRQLWVDRLLSGAPDGLLYTMHDLPVGALYHADWMGGWDAYAGPDGIVLTCVTPGGVWHIDSQASNCTRNQWQRVRGEPETSTARTFVRSHYCWIRSGDPRDPQGVKTGQPLHVGKDGNTCAAGAGSILCGKYHGFLHNGHLVDC